MAHDLPGDDGRQRLTRIQDIWKELKSAKDPAKYEILVERMRRESDVFLRQLDHDLKPPN